MSDAGDFWWNIWECENDAWSSRGVREDTRRDYLPCIRLVGNLSWAISKPRRSALATFALHNYNTIWQRYWAHIPCRFSGRLFSARARFYLKLWKKGINTDLLEGKGRLAELANTVWMCWPARAQRGRCRARPLHCPAVRRCLWSRLTFTSSKRLTGELPVEAYLIDWAGFVHAGWITRESQKNSWVFFPILYEILILEVFKNYISFLFGFLHMHFILHRHYLICFKPISSCSLYDEIKLHSCWISGKDWIISLLINKWLVEVQSSVLFTYRCQCCH